MPWNRTTTNTYLSNKTTGKLTEDVINQKISNMTTGNLTEHFQEFTQGDTCTAEQRFKRSKSGFCKNQEV